jgi:hypothetical protein
MSDNQAITARPPEGEARRVARTTHVVFYSSGAQELRRALKLARVPDRVLCFPDGLAIGPINPPDPAARVDWMVATLDVRRNDWSWLPSRVDAFWKSAALPETRYIVWYSRRSVYEYTGFLEWALRMGDAPYEVVDLTDTEVDRRTKNGDIVRRPVLTLAMTTHVAIEAAKLWNGAKSLTHLETRDLNDTWAGLRNANSAVRTVGPCGLASAPLSAFDEDLLAHTSEDWRKAYYLIGHVLAGGDLDYFQADDHFLAARVAALIKAGRLELRQNGDPETDQSGYWFSSVRLTGTPRKTPGDEGVWLIHSLRRHGREDGYGPRVL